MATLKTESEVVGKAVESSEAYVSPQASVGEGQTYRSASPALLRRFGDWIRLDSATADSKHGSWSNAGIITRPKMQMA